MNTHTALAGAPLPLLPSPKFHQMKFGRTTGSAQWYFQFYSVLSHFKGAGMTSSVDFVTHERIVSLRAKNIALHYPPPTSSHFLSQLLSLHLAPLQGLCVFAVPSAWCDFLCFIS